MDVWMSDNERGQSIPVVVKDGRYWVHLKDGKSSDWYDFRDWPYVLREPTTIHEMAMMAVLWRL